ncbi:hypothetical protein LEP1GSC195_3002 [Leptospira wolbachii serovar Codice str. CDC]|uniref:Uncharacterized protein n=1 Tax=Leptospira wolbachii serovar Codice str. CDC TaxID=1218599 RepID=R9A332_9LEPT|nr:hypothetical protein LEP1GSC195_3002 [Leptospira wolbachii serovar Codice str. CDC]
MTLENFSSRLNSIGNYEEFPLGRPKLAKKGEFRLILIKSRLNLINLVHNRAQKLPIKDRIPEEGHKKTLRRGSSFVFPKSKKGILVSIWSLCNSIFY